MRPQIIKLQRKYSQHLFFDISQHLFFDISHSGIFLDLCPTAKEIEAKINKGNLIKL